MSGRTLWLEFVYWRSDLLNTATSTYRTSSRSGPGTRAGSRELRQPNEPSPEVGLPSLLLLRPVFVVIVMARLRGEVSVVAGDGEGRARR